MTTYQALLDELLTLAPEQLQKEVIVYVPTTPVKLFSGPEMLISVGYGSLPKKHPFIAMSEQFNKNSVDNSESS